MFVDKKKGADCVDPLDPEEIAEAIQFIIEHSEEADAWAKTAAGPWKKDISGAWKKRSYGGVMMKLEDKEQMSAIQCYGILTI